MVKKLPLHEDHSSKKDLLRQMNEEARLEKIQLFLEKYKRPLIYGLTILSISIISLAIYFVQAQEKNKEYSSLLHQAMVLENTGKNKEAEEIMEKINSSNSAPDQIKVLSLLRYGAKMVDDGKIEQAVESYLAANGLKAADDYMRDLAGLLAVKTMIDSGDKSFSEKLKNILPRLEKNSTVLKTLITEQRAIFEWSNGNFVEAQKTFEGLATNAEAPEYLKDRAKQFANSIKNSSN